MGGTKHKGQIVKQDRRTENTDERIAATVIEMVEEHLDEFPFSARAVARRIGKLNSHTIITRGRDGLKGYYVGKRQDFLRALRRLVVDEQKNRGEISAEFCRKFGMLVISYHVLFALDIITRSFRNIEYLAEALSPLINEKSVISFGAELYDLLQEWHEDQFSRESFWLKYSKRLESLIHHYQITRPSTGLFSKSEPTTLPEEGGVF